MPKASAPNAPWVEVWLSPQTMVVPGRVQPCSGPMMWTMPWRDIVHGEIFDAEIGGVLRQGGDLLAAFRIGDALVAVLGRHIVVGHRQGQFGAAHLAAGVAQALKGLGAGHFMDQVAVDIDHGRLARRGVHQMRVPDLVVQRLAHGRLIL